LPGVTLKPERGEELERASLLVEVGAVGQNGSGDVVEDRQRREQIEVLEDEPDVPPVFRLPVA
jgi:hypothetical protein